MLTEQWSVKHTIKLGRSLFTNQLKLTSMSVDDIFKFKTKNFHAFPFIEYSIHTESAIFHFVRALA